jgi:tyrosyl-tRNA synthetase
MSFSEFTYPILQAWDWWHMYNTKGIQMQIGGADQFGNIVAGIDAVKYIAKTHPNPDVRHEEEDPKMVPFGFTVPLLTTAAGQKFGKTAGNAIWLDKEMTSCFDLYQVGISRINVS